MNSIYSKKMAEEYVWYFKMSIAFGLLFTFCIYRNMSGITFPVLTAGLILFSVMFLDRAGIKPGKDSLPYFLGIMLLGISTCMTANGFFHFFNYVGIILLFMAVMIHQFYDDKNWGFAGYVKKFFIFSWTWFISLSEPFRHRITLKRGNGGEKRKINRNVTAALCGLIAALLFLLVVMPLLMTSDRIFSQVFTDIFRVFDIESILENVDIWNIVGIILTFLVGGVGILSFFAAVFRMNLERGAELKKGVANPVTGITFTSVLAAVYVFYSAVQILFLFMRRGLPENMTYSQYAHEGFWQLLFVGIINFIAVVICMQIFEENRILKILLFVLSVCTCVMILSAAYRMGLYVGEYNLTFLRVLVLWFLGVLMLIFFGVMYAIFHSEFRLFRYILLIVSVMYTAFSFSRPDRIIAEYNISSTENLNFEDVQYLITGLSEDAAPSIAEISSDELSELEVIEYVGDYYSDILRRDGEMSLRQWNYSRSSAAGTAEKWLENVRINYMVRE